MRVQKLFLVIGLVGVVLLTAYLFFAFDYSLVICYFIAVNVVTLVLYALDKCSALTNGKFIRIPERTLHVLALVGGSLGALVGQFVFRHKVRKTSFLIVYYLIVVLQALVVWFVFFGYRLDMWPWST